MIREKTIKNIAIGMICQVFTIIISFFTRKIFIEHLGYNVLGINALFISIMGMLNLAELGLGASVTYSLYKPLAKNDKAEIIKTLNYLGTMYKKIAVVLIIVGLGLLPFLKYIVKVNYSERFLQIIFLLFLIDTLSSYFISYKKVILQADQRKYILDILQFASKLILSIIQIYFLVKTGSYILFLSTRIIITILENLISNMYINKTYFIDAMMSNEQLGNESKGEITGIVKALMFHKIGNYLVAGTDNIIIAMFVNITTVGIYANYQMVIAAVSSVLVQVSNGLMSTFGKILVIRDKKSVVETFEITLLFNFILYNWALVSLVVLIDSFIRIWIGESGILNSSAVIIILINFYVTGISEPAGSIRASAGMFEPDKHIHIFLAFVNLVISISLVPIIGIVGVFIGTLICLLLKELWMLPRIVYRNIFEQKVWRYYRKLFFYAVITFFSIVSTIVISRYIVFENSYICFIKNLILCMIIPQVVVCALLWKNQKFIELRKILLYNVIIKENKNCSK